MGLTTTPVPTTTPAPTTTPCPTTTPPCPTDATTTGAAPCFTAAIRLYSIQQGVDSSKSWAMSSVGMFALLSVSGLAAGVGASIFRRTRRNTRQQSHYENLEDGIQAPVE